MEYNLEERTTRFSEVVIQFCKKIPYSEITKPIINQLIRSATSIGANYCEADEAESKKDFRHKIGICKKEARETKYWLRLIGNMIAEEMKPEARKFWVEAKELTLIFNAIINSKKNT